MNNKIIWPYYIWMYFDILKNVNKKYRKLVKLCGKENHRKIEKINYEIMEGITQIIPYGYEKKKLKLKSGEGILELIANDAQFIGEELEKILKKYNDELMSIKIIRNNVEHSPHRVVLCAQVSGAGTSNITLNYYKKGSNFNNINVNDLLCCHCSTNILKSIISDVNVLFKKIRTKILEEKIDDNLARHYRKYKLKI